MCQHVHCSRLSGGQTCISLDLNASLLSLMHLVDEGTNMQVLGNVGMDPLSDLPNSTVYRYCLETLFER